MLSSKFSYCLAVLGLFRSYITTSAILSIKHKSIFLALRYAVDWHQVEESNFMKRLLASSAAGNETRHTEWSPMAPVTANTCWK